MNIDDGRIRELAEDQITSEREVMIHTKDLTEKQKKNKQVSLKDHRSKAGKILTEARWNDMNKNQQRNLRKKLKKK